MPYLAVAIREAVGSDRYVIGQHADERLRERGIAAWQIVDGIGVAKVIRERPNDQPNPSVEFEQILADGTPVKAVWSLLRSLAVPAVAKLVTVHFFDRRPL